MSYFYISFATPEDFLGATVIEAGSPHHAVIKASDDGLNPGGEAAVFLLGDINPEKPELVPFIGRLVDKEEMLNLHGGVYTGDMEPKQREKIEELSVIICNECNQD